MLDDFFKTFEDFSDITLPAHDNITRECLRDFIKSTRELAKISSRNRKTEIFLRIIDEIFNFCMYGGQINKSRCYAVGIAFIDEKHYGFCVKKLSKIFNKDISSINKNLKELQIETLHCRGDSNEMLKYFFSFVPSRKLKAWSLRECKNEELIKKYGKILNPNEYAIV